jgi:hypothetical protein
LRSPDKGLRKITILNVPHSSVIVENGQSPLMCGLLASEPYVRQDA